VFTIDLEAVVSGAPLPEEPGPEAVRQTVPTGLLVRADEVIE